VARTYDADTSQCKRRRMLIEFAFDVRAPLLEQVAHAEALNASLDDPVLSLAPYLCRKHPALFPLGITGHIDMDKIWRTARLFDQIRGTLNEDDELEKFIEISWTFVCDVPEVKKGDAAS
jgi:hypothetical protein